MGNWSDPATGSSGTYDDAQWDRMQKFAQESKGKAGESGRDDLEVVYDPQKGGLVYKVVPRAGGDGGGGGGKPKPPAKPKPKSPPGPGNKPPAPPPPPPPPGGGGGEPGAGGGSPVSGSPISPPTTAGSGGGGGGAIGGLMDAMGDGGLGYRQGLGMRQPPVSPGPLAGLRRIY